MSVMPPTVAVAVKLRAANYAEQSGKEMHCSVCKGTFSNHNLLRNEEDETGGIICPCCSAPLHVGPSVRINTPIERTPFLGADDFVWPA